MQNPLRKRIPRELKSEIGKYLVIFLLMLGTIGMVSGFLVADGSMIKAYNESFEKYNIEDGNFRTGEKVYRGQREAMEEQGIKIYENYYIEEALTNGSTMRFFKNRDEVDKVCIMEGRLPKTTGEIAIDRMYADNNSLKIGDTLSSGDKTWKIAGLIALSDYSALFQNNNDSMFDAVKFGVSVVTPEEFDSLDQEKLQYNYSWIYDKKPKDEKEEKEVSEDLMKEMGKVVTLENFVPRYQNQAIIFTGDDMGGDKAMMVMLLYGICLWYYDWQYDYKGSGCDRYSQSFRLYRKRADSTLYDPSGAGHAGGCTGWKCAWIYCVQRRMCGNVLWKLQPSDLCDGMECGSLSYDDSGTDRNHGTGELWNPSSQNAAFPTEISEKRSFRKKTEACSFFKSEDEDFYQIQISCNLSEYQ